MSIVHADRVPSFQRVGTVFDNNVTTRGMLDAADLSGWNVRVIPGEEAIDNYMTPKNLYFTVRDTKHDANQILGAVKSRYVPVQNEDAFAWADNILEGGGRWDSAGSFRESAVVFGAMEINEAEIVVDRNGLNDRVKMYLLISNSHDGSKPLQASITPVRIICQNTLNMALKTTKQSFKVKHTASADAKAMAARDALNLTFKYAQEFSGIANTMYQTKFSEQQFDTLIKQLYPKPEASTKADGTLTYGAVTRWQKNIDLIYDLRKSHTNRDIDGTAWGAYNTLTERLDWFRISKDTEASALAASGFVDGANNEKQNILDRILEMSGIAVH